MASAGALITLRHRALAANMKKTLMLTAFFVVHWTTVFRAASSDAPAEYRHDKAFLDDKEARAFYNHRPMALFECVNSVTGAPGFCEVKDVDLEKNDALSTEKKYVDR